MYSIVLYSSELSEVCSIREVLTHQTLDHSFFKDDSTSVVKSLFEKIAALREQLDRIFAIPIPTKNSNIKKQCLIKLIEIPGRLKRKRIIDLV